MDILVVALCNGKQSGSKQKNVVEAVFFNECKQVPPFPLIVRCQKEFQLNLPAKLFPRSDPS